jgi:hypothetical protein
LSFYFHFCFVVFFRISISLLNLSSMILNFSSRSWINIHTLFISLFESLWGLWSFFKTRLSNSLSFKHFGFFWFGYWGIMSFWKSDISLLFFIYCIFYIEICISVGMSISFIFSFMGFFLFWLQFLLPLRGEKARSINKIITKQTRYLNRF